MINTGNLDLAKRTADEYRHIFGKGNFYLEVQDNLIKEQEGVNKELFNFSKELGIPLVATNDVHYMAQDKINLHIWYCFFLFPV